MYPLSIYYDIPHFDSNSQIVFRALVVIAGNDVENIESNLKILFENVLLKELRELEPEFGDRIIQESITVSDNRIFKVIYDGRLNFHVSDFLTKFATQ